MRILNAAVTRLGRTASLAVLLAAWYGAALIVGGFLAPVYESRGYFLCWWPSGAAPANITATDANGKQVGRLTVPVRSTLAPVPSHN